MPAQPKRSEAASLTCSLRCRHALTKQEEMQMQRNGLSRRRVMAGATGVSAATILHWPANAAEFSYKFGASSPMDHPAMARTQEAANKIKQDSNGRMEITLYPNSVLGGDT